MLQLKKKKKGFGINRKIGGDPTGTGRGGASIYG
jgi:hypothetical protein